MKKLFYLKCSEYKEKPIENIKACEYEEGMEDGWVVEFCGEEFGFGFEIFDTKEDAIKYYNSQPQQTVNKIIEDKANEIKYTVDYYNPQPCLWHYETKEVADFGHSWNEKVYETIYEDDWLVDYGDGEIHTTNKETINALYDKVE